MYYLNIWVSLIFYELLNTIFYGNDVFWLESKRSEYLIICVLSDKFADRILLDENILADVKDRNGLIPIFLFIY